MQNEHSHTDTEFEKTFVDGIDFYFDDGLMVLTRSYLLSRGFCCANNCRHCPYQDEGTGPVS